MEPPPAKRAHRAVTFSVAPGESDVDAAKRRRRQAALKAGISGPLKDALDFDEADVDGGAVFGEESTTNAPEFDEKTGIAIEGFNLESERAEGEFDESGNFIWNRDRARARRSGVVEQDDDDDDEEGGEDGVANAGARKKADRKRDGGSDSEESGDGKDAWLQELDAMAPRERAALQARAKAAAARDDGTGTAVGGGAAAAGVGVGGAASASQTEPESHARSRLLHALVSILIEGETVAGALRRLGGPKDKALSWNVRLKARRAGVAAGAAGDTVGGASGSAAAAPAAAAPQSTALSTEFIAVTEAADALLRGGLTSIFTMSRRDLSLELSDALAEAGLSRSYFLEKQKEPIPAAAAGVSVGRALPAGEYEYTWAGGDGTVFGPFASEQLNAWASAGFFVQRLPLLRLRGGAEFVPLVDLTR